MPWAKRLYQKFVDLDWPATQRHLNRLEHFIATVQDPQDPSITLDVHFTHTKSSNPSAIPILCVHGWPGSFHEFDKVVEPLANPPAGVDTAFHVVVPSLPGFAWSSPPPRRGWTQADTARIFNRLMLMLGYTSYTAQAGDWGMFVARELGSKYSECKGVHLNFSPTPLPPELKPEDLTDRERHTVARSQDWLDKHLGYAVLMRTRPQSLSLMLHDNPMGILIFVGEKYIELSNPEIHNDAAWDEVILTTSALYYFSDCIGTSALVYYENITHAEFGNYQLKAENNIKCPFGYTSFKWDSRPGSKRTVERTGNLVFYNGTFLQCNEFN